MAIVLSFSDHPENINPSIKLYMQVEIFIFLIFSNKVFENSDTEQRQ